MNNVERVDVTADFDEHGDQLFAMTDRIAERARKIGGRAARTIGEIACEQSLTDNDQEYVDPQSMLIELQFDNHKLGAEMCKVYSVCNRHGATARRDRRVACSDGGQLSRPARWDLCGGRSTRARHSASE